MRIEIQGYDWGETVGVVLDDRSLSEAKTLSQLQQAVGQRIKSIGFNDEEFFVIETEQCD